MGREGKRGEAVGECHNLEAKIGPINRGEDEDSQAISWGKEVPETT